MYKVFFKVQAGPVEILCKSKEQPENGGKYFSDISFADFEVNRIFEALFIGYNHSLKN